MPTSPGAYPVRSLPLAAAPQAPPPFSQRLSYSLPPLTLAAVASRFLQSQPMGVSLKESYFKLGRECPRRATSSSDPVDFPAMSGLFILSGVVALLALLWGVAAWAARKCTERTKASASVADDTYAVAASVAQGGGLDHNATDGEVLREVLRLLHEQARQGGQGGQAQQQKEAAGWTEPVRVRPVDADFGA
jgi:hypothetical protein